MPSTYPGAPDDLSAGNTDLNHADVTNALAAVQATLGVNPQGDADTVADRLGNYPAEIDLPNAPGGAESPPAGYTRLDAITGEGEDHAPFLRVTNSEGFNSFILTEDDAGLIYLGRGVLNGYPPGTLLVKGPDATEPDKLEPGTDGQVLTADSTQPLGVRWADPA